MMDFLVSLLYGLVLLVVIAGLIVVAVLLVRGYLKTGTVSGSLSGLSSAATMFFRPRPERRLEVVDQASVDARRRLVLIRRDDVEHLIMTGGPVDVVIETGIGPRAVHEAAEVVEAPTAAFSRPPRAVGQGGGEH
jgi:hypothetical protein